MQPSLFSDPLPQAKAPANWHWLQPGWNDRLVEAEVIQRLNSGAITPREWTWPAMKPYNGSTNEQRIIGWQKVWAAVYAKLIPNCKTCSVCGGTNTIHYHCEDYLRPLDARPICKSCHFALHKRFSQPENWLLIVRRNGAPGDWFFDLRMLERDRGEERAEYERLCRTPITDCRTPYHGCGVDVMLPRLVWPGFVRGDVAPGCSAGGK